MQCPKCGLFNPPEALVCDCGYNFDKNEMQRPYFDTSKLPPKEGLKEFAVRYPFLAMRAGIVVVVIVAVVIALIVGACGALIDAIKGVVSDGL